VGSSLVPPQTAYADAYGAAWMNYMKKVSENELEESAREVAWGRKFDDGPSE